MPLESIITMVSDSDALILIGKIVRPRGLRGQVKVLPLTDFVEQFELLDKVIIHLNGDYSEYHIENVQILKNIPYLSFRGIENIDSAEKLRNCDIFMRENQRMQLPDDSFYFNDIEGFNVITTEGTEVGILYDIEHLPSSDLLVVEREDKKVLIPFVRDIVPVVDMKNRKIVIIHEPSFWEGDHIK